MPETFEFVVLDPEELVKHFGIPVDLAEELVPCLAHGVWENGKTRTLHMKALDGSPKTASVVFTPKGSFSRMVLHRSK